jgi:DNA-directed RNA polymerase specialized sigma24 family protein
MSGLPAEPVTNLSVPQSSGPTKAGGLESTEGSLASMSLGQDSLESRTAASCLKRIRRWRGPPRWSRSQWLEEIEAEVAAAILEARRDFNAARGVPWEAFLRLRIMSAALARYRREWTYALHRVQGATLEPAARDDGPPWETAARLIAQALGQLPDQDIWLIEGLFWEGKSEAELAESLGISQQAVNKRKRTIFRDLRRLIEALTKSTECGL